MIEVESTKKMDTCQTFCYDEEVVERVQHKLENMNGVELIFKALSDATRLKVAYALTLEEELCVCDVANILNTTTATASHHLRYLRNMGLAKYEKRGKLVFYSLPDNHIRKLVQLAAEPNVEVR
ncbi:ArsR family transcriptional regulator [Planococcus antarcticus DSM 14505]|uniref:ArsR family transcriptional regulator n=1 Tax=Planococcus antarcticus DSM 14505 TaxID=1185653 RepID=A0AA87LQG5_9BACL|nr:metalloregulator ArsR/SmtB family transcription factor [Planococcus antarcticus]EIM06268.1 ArsR family transcriptional regulator [Planococcus antarcticus DSM 14505]